jgi:hypothetical protein
MKLFSTTIVEPIEQFYSKFLKLSKQVGGVNNDNHNKNAIILCNTSN